MGEQAVLLAATVWLLAEIGGTIACIYRLHSAQGGWIDDTWRWVSMTDTYWHASVQRPWHRRNQRCRGGVTRCRIPGKATHDHRRQCGGYLWVDERRGCRRPMNMLQQNVAGRVAMERH